MCACVILHIFLNSNNDNTIGDFFFSTSFLECLVEKDFLDHADGNLTKVVACAEWPHPWWFPGFG